MQHTCGAAQLVVPHVMLPVPPPVPPPLLLEVPPPVPPVLLPLPVLAPLLDAPLLECTPASPVPDGPLLELLPPQAAPIAMTVEATKNPQTRRLCMTILPGRVRSGSEMGPRGLYLQRPRKGAERLG
jgi:hypothetical protein